MFEKKPQEMNGKELIGWTCLCTAAVTGVSVVGYGLCYAAYKLHEKIVDAMDKRRTNELIEKMSEEEAY